MNLTFTSIITTTLFVNMLIILLGFCCIFAGKTCCINPKFIIICIIFILIRCFIPVEFFFTFPIRSYKILPKIFDIINYKMTMYNIPFYKIIIFLWLIIVLIKLIFLIKKQIRIENTIQSFSNSKHTSFLHKIMEQKNLKGNIDLIEIPNLSTPALIGIFRTKIIIPEDVSKNDLYYFLLHELEHYKHKDLYIITALHFLCVIYWWNPLFYLLKMHSQNIMEIRTDNSVIEILNTEQKINYIESILNVAKSRSKKLIKYTLGVGFYEKQLNIEYRFNNIMNPKKKVGIFLPKMFLIFILTSAFIIIEPYSIKEEFSKDTFSISKESYFCENNGAFDLYIDGEYFITVDRLEGFENIKLINKEKDDEKN